MRKNAFKKDQDKIQEHLINQKRVTCLEKQLEKKDKQISQLKNMLNDKSQQNKTHSGAPFLNQEVLAISPAGDGENQE